MTFTQKIIACASIALGSSIPTISMTAPSLSQFYTNCHGACVLPFFINKKGERVFIVTREKGGSDKGCYDGFSGGKERGESHPVATAGRELCEESMGLFSGVRSTSQARNYIDEKYSHTNFIVANKHRKFVTYITHVSKHEATKFAHSFYAERKRRKKMKHQGSFLEKDSVAFVLESNLRHTARNHKPGTTPRVQAQVFFPNGRTGKVDSTITTISLRPCMVSTIKPYYDKKSYVTGNSSKIRFY